MSLIGSSEYRGTHSKFSPSRPSFMKMTDEQFIQAFHNSFRSPIGDAMHLWAGIQINQGFTCSSLRDMAKSIKTLIFAINWSEKYGLSRNGRMLLQEIKHIPKEVYATLKAYVNDSIVEGMEEEMELNYSDEIRGTADAVRFDEKNKKLWIFDLKTGSGLAHMEQLIGYAALYCLLNEVNPFDISYELRIYQKGEVTVCEPGSDEIKAVMDRIRHLAGLARKLYKGGAV